MEEVWASDDPWFLGVRATHRDLVTMLRDIKSLNPTYVLNNDDPIHLLVGLDVTDIKGNYHRFSIGLMNLKKLNPSYELLREYIRTGPNRKELCDMLVVDESFEDLWPKISY